MAGIAYCYKRLWNPGRDCIYGDTSNVLNYLERPIVQADGSRDYCRYFEIFWASTTQAGEELGTAPANDKDGTTTPFQLIVVSSDANDTDATTGDARKVAVIGVTVSSIQNFIRGEAPKLTVEVFSLNGTSDVASSRYYLWVIHGYVCDWGSGGQDAKGNITLEAPANTTLYQITATYNEAEGGRLHFADGDMVLWDFAQFANTATLAAGDGVILSVASTKFEDSLNGDPDFATDYASYMHYGSESTLQRPLWITPRKASASGQMIFTETLVANAKVISIRTGVRLCNRSKKSKWDANKRAFLAY